MSGNLFSVTIHLKNGAIYQYKNIRSTNGKYGGGDFYIVTMPSGNKVRFKRDDISFIESPGND